MPDSWESIHSLNANSALDGPQDSDGDGYTNLEEFLNTTDPWDGSPSPGPDPDTSPPVISSTSAEATSSTADIAWITDEPADSQVELCPTSAKCGNLSPLDSVMTNQHRVRASELEPARTYFFWARSADAAGNRAESGPVSFETASAPAPGDPIRVPQNYPTIQSAINAAVNGDVIVVSPGIYRENLTLSGQSLTLASEFYTTQDAARISQTVLDGSGAAVITVGSSAGSETRIIGFTIQNGADGISAAGKLHILHNRIIGNGDGIDYESGGGGICRSNVFENNSDDGIDLDGAVPVTIEDNTIRNNGNDGIEIRLHDYSGPTLDILIRNNVIAGNREDGIQLIDHPGASNRYFLIERNLFAGNAMAGLGLMDNGETVEDYRAASITDPIHLFNNTFTGNNHAVTGGDNLVALNNLFVGSSGIGIKGVDADSIAAYNLFWNNGTHSLASNIDAPTTKYSNPLLDVNHRLQSGSPAIDAGTALFEWKGQVVLNLPGSSYQGTAPDLGMYEYEGGGEPGPVNQAPVVSAGPDQTISVTGVATLAGTASDDGLPDPPATVTTLWSVVSGPGTVTFADARAAATTASFSTAGVYVLRLTASDGALTAFDETTITVSPASLTVTAISPNSVQAGSSVNANITGTGFVPGARLTFEQGQGSTPVASAVTVLDAGRMTATVTAGSGGPRKPRYWNVVVTNPDGTRGVLTQGFVVKSGK